ncbi:MAG: hypothetical protein AAF266_14960, partial [Planctomycetota bacterium]
MATTRATERRFETLETKQMLAGDVLVSVTDGALSIQGDELNNQIAITAAEQPGSYLIRGLTGTTVRLADGDGGESGPLAPETGLVVEGISGNVRVAMGEGDDSVLIDNASFRGAVNIGTGEGDDTVRVGGRPDGDPGPVPAEADGDLSTVRVGRSLRIATDGGEDTVVVSDTVVRGNLSIATGEGDDSVTIGRTLPPSSYVPEAPTIAEDEAPVVRPDVVVRGTTKVHLGAGEDDLNANSVRSRAFKASGGADSDAVRLNDLDALRLAVFGGYGDSSATINGRNLQSRYATFAGGAGDDN